VWNPKPPNPLFGLCKTYGVTPRVILKVAFGAIAANLFFDLIASNVLFCTLLSS
jgi:hypothetical protein